jgi:hypothetical protein
MKSPTIPLEGLPSRLIYFILCATSFAAGAQPDLYNPDPTFIWNRVHRMLHSRLSTNIQQGYGSDNLEPPLWPETQYLLTGESHRQALALLDEFLAEHAERMVTDPLHRAIFQHDLWAVFDWSDSAYPRDVTPGQRLALQSRLAQMIQRVALSKAEIEKLPDNLAQAAQIKSERPSELPFDLLKQDGPWVCVFPRGASGQAPVHRGFDRESSFLVFVRLPGGSQQTRSYLRRLDENPQAWKLTRRAANGPQILMRESSLPQFPAGTRFALLRQMLLLDNRGEVVATHLTESIQMRLHKTVPPDPFTPGEQENFEFRLSRNLLFAGKTGGLRQVTATETEFPIFSTKGNDPFEHSSHQEDLRALPILSRCGSCHEASGIYAVRSYANELVRLEVGPIETPGLFEATPAELIQGAIEIDRLTRHDLGLLQGMWLRYSTKL